MRPGLVNMLFGVTVFLVGGATAAMSRAAEISGGSFLVGICAMAFGTGLFLFGMVQFIRGSGASAAEPVDTAGGRMLTIVHAMAYVAMADGRAQEAEISNIGAILRNLAGSPLDNHEIALMIADFSADRAGSEYFRGRAHGLDEADRDLLCRAVLFVAASEGGIGRDEIERASEVAIACGVSGERFHALLAEVRQNFALRRPAAPQEA